MMISTFTILFTIQTLITICFLVNLAETAKREVAEETGIESGEFSLRLYVHYPVKVSLVTSN